MKRRSETLDLLRGLAALLVMLGSLRSIFFVPFNQLPEPTFLLRVFYFFTGFGHQCVIVFFVLSGYFVGGAFDQQFDRRRIRSRLKNYGVSRMARLWTVLVPALVLTWALDTIGLSLTGSAVYTTTDFFPYLPLTNDLSFGTFIGNVFFLQTLLVPTFGSNAPLWSLANEFWYYCIFPALYLAFARVVPTTTRTWGFVVAVLILVFLYLFNTTFLEGLVIWLLGFGASLVRRRLSYAFRLGCIVVFVTAFLLIRVTHFPYQDMLLGFATAALVLSIKQVGAIWISRSADFLSRISYTLYLVHLPIIIFIKTVILPDWQMEGGLMSLFEFALLATAIVVLSYGVYWVFERNTDVIKRKISAIPS